jgi:cell division protein FtsL
LAHTGTGKFTLPGVLNVQSVRIRRDLRDLRFMYLALLTAVLCVAVLFVYLWSRLTVVNTAYEISRAKAARSVLAEQNNRLRIEHLRLKSPERIEGMAARELGLVHPGPEQVIRIK